MWQSGARRWVGCSYEDSKVLMLTVPWPPANLSPNARVHWAALAKAKKKYRKDCGWLARAQGARRMSAERLDVTITLCPPVRGRGDFDNNIASLKAGIDGIADAIGIDDSKWRMTFKSSAPQGNGLVMITIS